MFAGWLADRSGDLCPIGEQAEYARLRHDARDACRWIFQLDGHPPHFIKLLNESVDGRFRADRRLLAQFTDAENHLSIPEQSGSGNLRRITGSAIPGGDIRGLAAQAAD